MEQYVFYYIDTTEHSELDYKNGVDMKWSNFTEGYGKPETIREAKRIFNSNPDIKGIRVDKNCLKKGAERIDTIFTLFR